MHGGSLPRHPLGLSILIHELTIDAANPFVEPLDPTALDGGCGALHLIARGLLAYESP
jgi:hypothetical protein